MSPRTDDPTPTADEAPRLPPTPRPFPALLALLLLLALNLGAHFVPFERSGFDPDDYTNALRVRDNTPADLSSRAWRQPDRPLSWWMLFEIARPVGTDARRHLLAVLAASSLLVACVFALFCESTRSNTSALALSVLFVFWPAWHPHHGGLVFATGSLVASLNVGAATLFLRFARTGGAASLLAALALYAAGCLSTELGLLVPVVAWGVARWQGRPRHAWALTFAVIAAAVILRRFALAADAPTIGPARLGSAQAVLFNLAWVLPAHFVGHIAVRNVVYGLWGFVHLPLPLLAGGLAVASAFGALSGRMAAALPRIDRRDALGLALGVYALALPACLVLVESRHTALSTIAFAPLLGAAVRWGAGRIRWLTGLALGLLLAANQGLALRQAEAGRLSAAVFGALRERKEEISKARTILWDVGDLAHRIPYTWRPKPDDLLTTYWGLHMLAAWGFEDSLELLGHRGKETVLCAGPVRRESGAVECARVFSRDGADRSWHGRADETVVLGFEEICGPPAARCPPSR